MITTYFLFNYETFQMLSFFVIYSVFFILDKGCYDIVEKNLQEFPANGRNGSTKNPPGIESNVTVGNVTKK